MIAINGTQLPATEAREERIRAEYLARTLSNALRVVQVASPKRRVVYTTAPLAASQAAYWLGLDGQTVSVTDPVGTWSAYARVRISSWPAPGYMVLELEVEEL